MTRAEHIAWAKARALEYLDSDRINAAQLAAASIASDMGKYDGDDLGIDRRQLAIDSVDAILRNSGDEIAAVRAFIEEMK